MQLEEELGIHSCFNFVPEGDYEVPVTLLDELRQKDFEIGIHDLKHDGRLFVSRRGFSQHAARINHYINQWRVCGFRAAFMLHKLDWLHELDIVYDMSTFDTDPFEPQPDGHHTIFPFWVENQLNGNAAFAGTAARGGYVELPYTLPQDFTLFLLLKEQTPDIWIKKLDWIARHGGMALVNIHPDYVCFDGTAPNRMEYPASHYKALLEYIRERYDGRFWNTTPAKVAEFFANATKRAAAREV
jgi:hypothetical protein